MTLIRLLKQYEKKDISELKILDGVPEARSSYRRHRVAPAGLYDHADRPAGGGLSMRARGFTLIELVVVIAIGAIVVSFMAMFIVRPVQAYGDQTRRAELVDAADSALRFMARDLRGALPNSIRVADDGAIVALELLATLDGARYRDGGPLADSATELDFTAA